MNPSDIRKLRSDLSISQSQLAHMVGVSPAAVAHWESGRNTPPTACLAIMMGLQTRIAREGATEDMKRVVSSLLIAGGVLALLYWIFEKNEVSKGE